MSSRNRSLFGSKRGRFIKETKRSSTKTRSQRVKFRRRYASAQLKSVQSFLIGTLKIGFSVAVLGWAGFFGWSFLKSNPYFRIQDVFFEGDIPPGLPQLMAIKTGDNIFKIKSGDKISAAMKEYPQLKSLKINRGIDRRVMVKGVYREPVALVETASGVRGLDEGGLVFSLTESKFPWHDLPFYSASGPEPIQQKSLNFLLEMKNSSADFYSRLKQIETDKMGMLRLTMKDETAVKWGEMDPSALRLRVTRLMKIFERFEPIKQPAALLFVTDDRIVMSANWKQKGGDLVKTGNSSGT